MASFLLISGIICIVIGAVSVVPEEDAYWIGEEIFLIAITRVIFYHFYRLFEEPVIPNFMLPYFL
jgi:uncharacterized membrane protein SirB2